MKKRSILSTMQVNPSACQLLKATTLLAALSVFTGCSDGKDGVDGANGLDGVNGMDGIDGIDGMDGVDGANGLDARDVSFITPDLSCVDIACETQNKLIVAQIFNDVINRRRLDWVTEIYADDVESNNVNIADGLPAIESHYADIIINESNQVATIKHIVGDGDYVAVHWHFSETPGDEKTGEAKVDLFLLEDGLVIERWDVTQTAEGETASTHSMFSDLYVYADGTGPNTDSLVEETNKTTVTDFYLTVFNNSEDDDVKLALFDMLIETNYLQHNRFVDTGAAALRGAVPGNSLPNVDSVGLSLAEDDLVWTFRFDGNEALGVADLWRFDNNIDQIVEHWDVF